MRLYLDTEYNGFGGPLISIALVSPNHLFYEAQELLCPIDPWVQQHVYPVLGIKEENLLLPTELRAKFHDWISRFDYPEIVCDWHADAAHFCNLLQGQEYGTSLDFSCRITILKTPPGQPVSLKPHNALADATALMGWHRKIMREAA